MKPEKSRTRISEKLKSIETSNVDVESNRTGLRILENKIISLNSELNHKHRQIIKMIALIKQRELELRAIKKSVLDRVNIPYRLLTWWNLRKSANIIRKSGRFDQDYYYDQNPDVAQALLDPIVHYLKHGAVEGRNPNPTFDTVFYLAGNPDVLEDGINPFLHYIQYGEKEGREPCKSEIEIPAIEDSLENTDVLSSDIVMCCDVLQADINLLSISGWALASQGIKGIEILVDNKQYFPIKLETTRFDVAKAYPTYPENVRCGFNMNLPISLDIGEHNLCIEVSDNNRITKSYNYTFWVSDHYQNFLEYIKSKDLNSEWIKYFLGNLTYTPQITLVIIVENVNTLNTGALKNLDSIIYTSWNVIIASKNLTEKELITTQLFNIGNVNISHILVDEINDSIEISHSEWIGILNSDCQLFPNTLFEFILHLNLYRNSDIIYCDEDISNKEDKCFHYFKPDYSDILLLTNNYIGGFFLIARDIYLSSGGYRNFPVEEAFHDLLLRSTNSSDRILHIPMILYSRIRKGNSYNSIKNKIISENLIRRKINGELVFNNSIINIKFLTDGSPKVSIIILTGYINPQTNLLRCLKSISRLSTYENYEIIIVDNSRGLLDGKIVDSLFKGLAPVTYIEYDDVFNYSKMNNIAVKECTGDYVILLNDDTEIITEQWIEYLVGIGQLRNIGVVGAKLYFPDHTIEHSGIVLGADGVGRHPYRSVNNNTMGYHNYLFSTRNCSAVTFACVLISKNTYLKLGGLDENLDIECNDTEFCARATNEGYHVVWTPLVELYHNEASSRGPQQISVERNRLYFLNKWKEKIESGDPFLNKNLLLQTESLPVFNHASIILNHYEPLEIKEVFKYKRRKSVDKKSIKKILIIKLDHIGDMILAIPAIRLLKKIFPNAETTLLCAPWTKPIAELIDGIDNIITYKFFNERSDMRIQFIEPRSFKKLISSRPFDLAIDLRRHGENRVLLKYVDCHNIGFNTKKPDDSYISTCVLTPNSFIDIPSKKSKYHISSQLLYLIRAAFNLNNECFDEQRKLPMLPANFSNESNFGDIDSDSILIGIHPFSGNLSKQWPIDRFSELINLLIRKLNAHIVLFGTKSEKQQCNDITYKIENGNKVTSLVGKISLNSYIQFIQQVDLFIGNDSGPGHIAGSFDIPSVIIFSGRIPAAEWHPFGKNNLVLESSIWCAPCYKSQEDPCPIDNACLTQISVFDVFQAVNKVLLFCDKRTNKP